MSLCLQISFLNLQAWQLKISQYKKENECSFPSKELLQLKISQCKEKQIHFPSKRALTVQNLSIWKKNKNNRKKNGSCFAVSGILRCNGTAHHSYMRNIWKWYEPILDLNRLKPRNRHTLVVWFSLQNLFSILWN